MSADETYNGWTNRETWAVALHINNDQGWQESAHEALRDGMDAYGEDEPSYLAAHAGAIIRENVEEVLGQLEDPETRSRDLVMIAREVGSLWRVNWQELGAAFLSDLDES